MAKISHIGNKTTIVGKTEDPLIADLLIWIGEQEAEGLEMVASNYVSVQNNRCIVRHDDTNTWDREYDFANTTHSVIRYYMLLASQLYRFYKPAFQAKQNNRRIAKILPTPLQNSNRDGRLAGDRNEAKRIAGEFDRLFPIHWIESMIENIIEPQRHPWSKTFQMVVIDQEEQIVWWFIATLTMNRAQRRQHRNHVIRADPEISIFRYEYRRKVNDMGLKFLEKYDLGRDDNDDKDEDVEDQDVREGEAGQNTISIEDLRRKMKDMTIQAGSENKV